MKAERMCMLRAIASGAEREPINARMLTEVLDYMDHLHSKYAKRFEETAALRAENGLLRSTVTAFLGQQVEGYDAKIRAMEHILSGDPAPMADGRDEALRRALVEVDSLRRQLDSVLEERLAADALGVERAVLSLSYPQASDPRVRRWLAPQPEPTGEGRRVTEWLLGYLGDDEPLLCDVIRHRRCQGLQRYGTELRAHNGRDALADEAQELVDAALYCAQQKMEGSATHEDMEQALQSLRRVVELLVYRDETEGESR